ncbi:anthranilate synthase component II [Aliidiomarina halalkaliphila]|uniref:anthranilate synthase n=1 Tax=Aliidiomarina halalkaliphila TaxID=2593535 RepID=A0A552X518_9GAMM|nr:gamma-glutamyl-gamma-aminobutyrate hydrolase family protein [Aliidiomarina halalkaliphila]TRW50066.1 anthranilate synthase component II [Aliidiomarina halalkaliphila]
MSKGHIIFIDNVDSFTYNLVDELAQLGYSLSVYRNTVTTDFIAAQLAAAAEKGPVILCLSPGPGHPRDAGNLMEVIAHAAGRYPILGICLGFQALIEFCGGNVDRCHETVHGKTSYIECNAHPMFDGLSQPLPVARYHSLQAVSVPSSVTVVASVNSIPMAFEAPELCAIGFQFHPESIMTSEGSLLLKQTIDYLSQCAQHMPPAQPSTKESVCGS